MKKASLVIFACAMCACTPYQPSGFMGGYEEKEISTGEYDLYYYFNGHSAMYADNIKYWNRRAAELCGGPSKYEIIGSLEQRTFPKMGIHGKIKCKP